MKGKIKFFTVLMVIAITAIMSFQVVYATSETDYGSGYNPNLIPSDGEVHENLKTPIQKVWNTVILIVQIASFAGIIIAGIRYMFASADKKADIKHSVIYLVIGCVLVFGASTVINFATSTYYDAIGEEYEAKIAEMKGWNLEGIKYKGANTLEVKEKASVILNCITNYSQTHSIGYYNQAKEAYNEMKALMTDEAIKE